MEISKLFDPHFWHVAWENAADGQELKDAPDQISRWNQRAAYYAERTSSGTGSVRVQDALTFLDAFAVLNGKLRILDIGCGPGNFAIAFAERGHEVVALDPAEEMLKIIRTKISDKPHLEHLITTVQADWTLLQLADFGWEGHFDLVFASMTPGINGPHTLCKAMQATKKYMYVSQFAGPRRQPALDDLWLQLQGKPYFRAGQDVLLPLMWLYSHGYKPHIHYSEWEREHRQTQEEAVLELLLLLSARMPVDEAAKQAASVYVAKRTDSAGFFTEKRGAAAAMLLWNINKKSLPLGG